MTESGKQIILNGSIYVRRRGKAGVFGCGKCCFYSVRERLCRAPIECLQECRNFEYWKKIKNTRK